MGVFTRFSGDFTDLTSYANMIFYHIKNWGSSLLFSRQIEIFLIFVHMMNDGPPFSSFSDNVNDNAVLGIWCYIILKLMYVL